MAYQSTVGRLSPLILRDVLLDFVLGKKSKAVEPMWEYYGHPRLLFKPVDDPKLLTHIYGVEAQSRAYFFALLLALDTISGVFEEFYGDKAEQKFLELREEMMQERRCMLYFKLIAWLTVDDPQTVQQQIKQMEGLELSYGLVTQYPEPILHAANCFACYDMERYIQALPEGRWAEINEEVQKFVAENSQAEEEHDIPPETPEENDAPAKPMSSVFILDLSEQIERQKLWRELMKLLTRWFKLALPFRQNLQEFLKRFITALDKLLQWVNILPSLMLTHRGRASQ